MKRPFGISKHTLMLFILCKIVLNIIIKSNKDDLEVQVVDYPVLAAHQEFRDLQGFDQVHIVRYCELRALVGVDDLQLVMTCERLAHAGYDHIGSHGIGTGRTGR